MLLKVLWSKIRDSVVIKVNYLANLSGCMRSKC